MRERGCARRARSGRVARPCIGSWAKSGRVERPRIGSWAKSGRVARAEAGFGLVDVLLATVVLLVVLVPAAGLLSASRKAVTTSQDQAVAQGLANAQIDADRNSALAALPPASFPTQSATAFPSGFCTLATGGTAVKDTNGYTNFFATAGCTNSCDVTATGYTASQTAYLASPPGASARRYYLTGCYDVHSTNFYVWQNAGWCAPDQAPPLAAGNLGNVSSATTAPGTSGVSSYWVGVVVSWGAPEPAAPSTTIPASQSVVLTSALPTPLRVSIPAPGSIPGFGATCPL